MNKLCQILGLCVVLLGSTVPGAERPESREQGPSLSDSELLACLDPKFPGLEKVVALQKRGDTNGALAALGEFVRTREEPADFGQNAEHNPQANTAHAERILGHQFTVVGIPYTFGSDIDWGFNPTTAPGTSYERDHEWTWQLNRHSAWVTLARAYQATGDERFAKEFDAQFADWVRECPVPSATADQRP